MLQGRALIRCKHTSGELAVEKHSELFLLILVYTLTSFGEDAGVRTPSCWDEGLLRLGFAWHLCCWGPCWYHQKQCTEPKGDKAIPLVPRKPHNHTISVTEAQRISEGRVRVLPLCLTRSDLAFIGGYHGLVDLRVGEIDRICGPTQSRREPFSM